MTTAIESKQDATKQSQKEQLETFSCMLDIGEAMLATGADVDTVEDILVKMGKAYGAYKMDVLVITELIIATATMPGHNEHTLSRRILNEGSTNFDRLEALTDLCKSYCQSPIPADDLRKSLQRIKGKPFPKVSLYLGGALAAGGFAIFFGGSLIDGLVSAFFALGICFCIKHFQKLTPNAMVFNFLTSFIFGRLVGRYCSGGERCCVYLPGFLCESNAPGIRDRIAKRAWHLPGPELVRLAKLSHD